MPKTIRKTLFLLWIRVKFEFILLNTKFFNLVDNLSINEKRFNKILGPIANNIRIKGF